MVHWATQVFSLWTALIWLQDSVNSIQATTWSANNDHKVLLYIKPCDTVLFSLFLTGPRDKHHLTSSFLLIRLLILSKPSDTWKNLETFQFINQFQIFWFWITQQTMWPVILKEKMSYGTLSPCDAKAMGQILKIWDIFSNHLITWEMHRIYFCYNPNIWQSVRPTNYHNIHKKNMFLFPVKKIIFNIHDTKNEFLRICQDNVSIGPNQM